ncbi:tRNA (guanosine(46)-N7)-methyltransferase TrmB [Erysipelothrix sp. HDW6C]|uniref:tRNA (guanosine(46)-N7)-methyltransferase TrmB n=1 Tax=Erysipelothrix sp. HDW6C TaxID=2714930 RepID=UPI00140B79CB|nr:tRNA (guanosine(46)-N7)-methyltransferase TrmB [Erysipelothrix sp. HDW6C]QIK70335.1 tRNA (guanosine(46)-N7)-methyltransferase TrmB [Erysipelothrix sp. HDW6C]
MRLRKKDWSSEIFETFSNYLVSDYEAIKGNWKHDLDAPIMHVEIGAGKGDYWHQLSAMYPERAVVAMERDYTASSIALKKLEEHPGDRKRFIFGDAEKLSDMFANGEVDIIHLNFSDPWKKTRHEKRRLTYKTKLDDYYDVLTDTGEIHMKTDNVGLFNYSLVSVGQHKFELVEAHVDFRAQDHEDPFTEYERKFHELGQPIFRAVWRKKDVK